MLSPKNDNFVLPNGLPLTTVGAAVLLNGPVQIIVWDQTELAVRAITCLESMA
jgi:hypothetical protein